MEGWLTEGFNRVERRPTVFYFFFCLRFFSDLTVWLFGAGGLCVREMKGNFQLANVDCWWWSLVFQLLAPHAMIERWTVVEVSWVKGIG